MVIDALYRKYFQKSKVFLYPLLDIKRGTRIVPTETYVSWNDTYGPEDMKLVCVYAIENNDEYRQFEKNILLKHTRITDYVKIDDKTAVFVFDLSDLGDDWFHFINGQYSKIDINVKRKILNFFDKNGGNHLYMNSFLFPEKFFQRYAEILDVAVSFLESVGELCSKPDLQQEKLTINVADLENINNSELTLE